MSKSSTAQHIAMDMQWRITVVWSDSIIRQYGLSSFQAGGIKLERFLHKNQHTQRKSLNFEFWINGELSKIGHHFSNKVIQKLTLSKNVNNKKMRKIQMIFDIEN